MSDNVYKVSFLPKLKDDGSNWHSWKEKANVHICSKVGLRRHLLGRIKAPSMPVERNGKFYKTAAVTDITPLSDDDLEAIYDKVDEFDQREAEIRNIIYQCVSETTLNSIKSESTACKAWTELCRLF
ncbi:hypothetical protein F5050DRAFT_1567348, partial [Lentinula boryana]